MSFTEQTSSLWHGVVVGFDGTDRARCAVRWAAAESVARGCPLHVVRVVVHHAPAIVAGWTPVLTGPDELARDHIEDELVAEVDACRAAYPGLEVHAAMHAGPPYARLAEHADQVGANVLAVGCSDLGAVSRVVFGSTGAELIRATSRRVVVVRDLSPVQQAAIATGYAPVVAFLDDRDTSPRVLGFAYDVANRWGAGVTVVHTQPDAGGHTGAKRSIPATVLCRQLDVLRQHYPGVPTRVETLGSDFCHVVLEHSADARLVVLGDRRQGVVHRLLAGSTGHRIMHHARCSVAVVPQVP
jgi:nucleotide-binding universal stress UspA family protein